MGGARDKSLHHPCFLLGVDGLTFEGDGQVDLVVIYEGGGGELAGS